MLTLVRSGRLFWIACLAAFFPLACSQSLESNEQFQNQVSRLDKVDEELNIVQRSVARIDTELQQVTKEVRTLKDALNAKGVAGAPADAVKALEQRLIGLEAQLKKVPAAPAAAPAATATAATTAKPRTVAPAPRTTAAAKPALQVTGVTTPSPKAPAGTKAGGRATRKAPPTKPAAPPAKPTGTYYNVTASDTLAAIASKNNISAEVLLGANRLPPNARLYAGQQLFIPSK